MCPCGRFLALVNHHSKDFSGRLDDTLLNRLESSLYCENNYHESFWLDFYENNFEQFIESFDEETDDTTVARGILKIKFSVIWRMRKLCSLSDIDKVNRTVSNMIISKQFSSLSALYAFFKRVLHENSHFNIFNAGADSQIVQLKNLYKVSPNFIHRRSIVTLLVLLMKSPAHFIKNGKSDSNPLLAHEFSPEDIDFLTDLATEIFLSSNYCERNCSIFLKQSSLAVLMHFKDALSDAKFNVDDIRYLLLLLSPYLPPFRDKLVSDLLSNVQVEKLLRRLIVNGTFQECSVHRQLVETWYSRVQSCFNEATQASLERLVSPLSTCPKTFTHHRAFRELLPPTFVDNVWQYAAKVFSNHQDCNYQNGWLLYKLYCHLQDEPKMKEQLFYLLQQLSEQPGLSAELPSLMDCVFVLYTNLSHLTHPERLKIFLIIYNLAHQECSNLKANGGCLSFSFLLMRIFDCSLVSEEVTLRLIQLQTLVSIKIAEDPGLMANETVIAIHRGLFTADLLKPEARTTFSLHVCMEILKLVTHLHELSRLVDNANVFPSSLKGILLACLLRCFTNLNVLQHLKATGSYKIAVESCISLESIDLEEDPSIRQAVLHCWNNLLEETDTQNSTELSDLSAQLKSHFRLVPSAQIGGAVCPSCNECLHDLLEDIVLAKRPAGDVDCTGD